MINKDEANIESARGLNPFHDSISLTGDLESEINEEIFLLNNSRLELVMDREEDFCICHRCRSISNASHRAGFTPPSFQSTFGNRRPNQNHSTNGPLIEHHDSHNVNEHDDSAVAINSGRGYSVDMDDVPFLLDDSYENEEVDHCHFPKPSSQTGVDRARRQLIISSSLCVAFMLAEFIGGYISGSLAIMTDAAHLLSDLASFLISLFALWVGQKKPTKRMSFGYYRAEILGAVASVLIIWVLTGILVYMAIQRIITSEYDIDADAMIIVSGVGVAINILMGIVLHGFCCDFGMPHSHHGHSHAPASAHTHSGSSDSSKTQNINVRAAFIHVIGDLIQSIGVLIAAYVIRYYPQYKIADPICTFLFSALVLFTTLSIMKDAVWVLMEGFPRNLSYLDIITMLKTIPEVRTVHSLHIWSLTTDKNALAVHIAIEPSADPHLILRQAQSLVRKEFGIFQATVQVEKYQPEMTSCKDCQSPE